MKFSPTECFLLVVVFLAIGEFVATKTKAYIPSVFVAALCFLIGFWTFVPKNVVTQASFGTEYITICMSLLLVHLGTLMRLRKLIEQWKAVVVAIIGICGTILLTMTIGRLFFNHQVVIAATPPLTGGIVAALLMSQALTAKGLTTLAAIPVAMFVIHSFIGYPLTSYCLKKEGKRVISDYRVNGPDQKVLQESMSTDSQRKKLIPRIPDSFLSPYLILAKVILVALLATFLSNLTKGVIDQYVICLILGVVFCELGFLDESSLTKAGVLNWLMIGLLAYVFSTLNTVTPAVLLEIIVPIIVLIILGVAGMFVTSSFTGKALGLSREMGFACALTSLFGFPADYIITHEVCKSVSENEEEREYLVDVLLPRMLVGGFATVSIASVIIATVFIKLL